MDGVGWGLGGRGVGCKWSGRVVVERGFDDMMMWQHGDDSSSMEL